MEENKVEKIEPKLTGAQLKSIIDQYKSSNSFSAYIRNQLYYRGRNTAIIEDGIDRAARNIDPNNVAPLPFARRTVNDMVGYAYRPNHVTYVFEENDTEAEKVLEYNLYQITSSEEYQDAVIKGESGEVMWYDGEKISFAKIPREECIFQYKDLIKGKLDFSIRFYKQEKIDANGENLIYHYAEVYDSFNVFFYEMIEFTTKQQEQKLSESTTDFSSTSYYYKGHENHIFGDVPLYPMEINQDKIGVFEPGIPIIDILDSFGSNSIANAIDRFNDTLLLLSKTLTDEQIQRVKELKVFDNLGDDGWVKFLNRDIEITSTVAAFELYERLYYDLISVIRLTDETFNSSSGIAIMYKLVPFENNVAQTEVYFTRSLLHRLDLINNALMSLGKIKEPAVATVRWRRNLPFDLQSLLTMIKTIKDSQLPISNETILKWIPDEFINDAVAEIEKFDKEREDNGTTLNDAIMKEMNENRVEVDEE